MNKLYPVIALTLASSVAIYSCKSPEVEIVESNYAYTIDKDKVQVEMPTPFEYSSSNVTLLKNGNVSLAFKTLVTPVSKLIDGTAEVELKLTSRAPLADDVKFSFRLDPEAAEAAKDQYKGYLPLPVEALDIADVVISKGTKDASFKIRLKESLAFFSEGTPAAPGYYCFLHLVSGNPEIVLPAKSGNLIAVSVKTEYSNIFSNEMAQIDKMYEGVKVASVSDGYNIGEAANLTDGNPSNGFISGARSPEFVFDLTAVHPLSGFRFHAASHYGSPYYSDTAEVLTSEDGKDYTSQGRYSLKRDLSLSDGDFGSYRFASPVTARYVKFICRQWTGYGEVQFFGSEGTSKPKE
ncbi:MAG: discoidin domain-containing protein [Porphyromonas sp.]|nr:discoidin domain-containing protein [Bacteroidales bacterium]MDY3100766.1 discoidin domain-containing protein [Porphyromonas sp.]